MASDIDFSSIPCPYFIVMPRLKDDVMSQLGSFFAHFDINLINSVPSLHLISHLPSTLGEARSSWVQSIMEQDSHQQYEVMYVYEDNVDQTMLPAAESVLLGAIFVLEGCSDSTIEKLVDRFRLPIVSFVDSKCEVIDARGGDAVLHIFKKWSERIGNVVDEFSISVDLKNCVWEKYDKTNYCGYVTDRTHFLNPLSRTIDRIRGLYRSIDKGLRHTPMVHPGIQDAREKSADRETMEALKSLLTEKFMCELLPRANTESGSKNLLEKVGVSEEELISFIQDPSWERYELLREKFLQSFNALSYKTVSVVSVPSVNYFLVRDLQKRLRIPKKLFRKIYDSNTYYGSISAEEMAGSTTENEQSNWEHFVHLLGMRAGEFAFLSYAHVFYALGQRLPYIRTRNVPAQPIYLLTEAMSKYSDKMETRNKVGAFNRNMQNVSSVILNSVNTDLLKTIVKHSSHLKVISDLPIEWVEIDGLPLCLETSFSRVPLTPGNGVVGHKNAMSNHAGKLTINDINVLVLNTLQSTDALYEIGRSLHREINEHIKLIGREANYSHVTNAEDFFRVINSCRPNILVYYGHATYSEHDLVGNLIVGSEAINAVELEKLEWIPKIVLLGACDTQVLHGTHLNVASMFLGLGSLSVLGSFFPIDGSHAYTFIAGLIRHLVNAFRGESPRGLIKNWGEVILQTQRTHYLLEPIYTLGRYLSRRNESVDSVSNSEDFNKKYWENASDRNIQTMADYYRCRDEIYSELFSTNPKLKAAFDSIIKNRLIVPQSTFYTSLGSPELIELDYGAAKDK